jgi:hypothetical protein
MSGLIFDVEIEIFQKRSFVLRSHFDSEGRQSFVRGTAVRESSRREISLGFSITPEMP